MHQTVGSLQLLCLHRIIVISSDHAIETQREEKRLSENRPFFRHRLLFLHTVFVQVVHSMDRMLSPIVTTILSYIVVIVTAAFESHDKIVSYVSYRISNYYIRKGKGSVWILVNATFSSTLCFSILSTYVNDIYAWFLPKWFMNRLVYQGDYEIIKKTMSIMLLLTLLHTFIVFPILAVPFFPFHHD